MSGIHVHGVDTGDEFSRSVRVEGAGETTMLSLSSTHPLADDMTPWLPLVLPAAMHLRLPLHLHGTVDRRALERQGAAQDVLHGWFPDDVGRVTVDAESYTETSERAPGTALLFSGGVDAFHSALRHRDHISHLLFVHGFDIPLWRTELRATVSRRLRVVADELGVELIEATVDAKPWMDQFVRWGEIYHGAATAGVSLAHTKVVGEALIASSEALDEVEPWGSHPDLDPLWSSSAMDIVHDAIEYDRAAKVRDIGSWDLAMQHLRVCWENPGQVYNCGDCEKCVRTMVNLHIAGVLDRCATLPAELDLARVRRPALNTEERFAIKQNLRVLHESGRLDPELDRALRTALRRGAALLPLERYVLDPARRFVVRPVRQAALAAAGRG